MAGSRGPIGKRVDQRHGHRSKAENAVDKIGGAAAVGPALGVAVHPLVADWYGSLSDGPESRFYTPAMWQRARIVAVMLSKVLESPRPSSQMYAALQSDMKSLLVDAGELRRLGIEIQPAEALAADNVIDYRARVSARG